MCQRRWFFYVDGCSTKWYFCMNIVVDLLNVMCLLHQLFSKWIENIYGFNRHEMLTWLAEKLCQLLIVNIFLRRKISICVIPDFLWRKISICVILDFLCPCLSIKKHFSIIDEYFWNRGITKFLNLYYSKQSWVGIALDGYQAWECTFAWVHCLDFGA